MAEQTLGDLTDTLRSQLYDGDAEARIAGQAVEVRREKVIRQ